jgi:hypothetical protein
MSQIDVAFLFIMFTGRLLKAGSTFRGFATIKMGLLLFNRMTTLVIQSLYRSPVFPSHAIVKAFLSIEYEGQVYSMSCDNGRFVYATRRLEMSFIDFLHIHVVIECVFLEADDDRMRCTSSTAATGAKVANFISQRA